jgi:hypothetical protein
MAYGQVDGATRPRPLSPPELFDSVLANPTFWRYAAVQAAVVAAEHQPGSPACSAFLRLASVARDLHQLGDAS